MNEIEQLKRMRKDLPGAREEARGGARAALMERAAPAAAQALPRRRRIRRRAFAFLAAGGLAAAAVLVALGSGGTPAAKPEVASAAELRRLAAELPRLQIAGPWQILSIEGTGEGGNVKLRFEGEADEEAQRRRAGAPDRAEIQWRTAPEAEREAGLLAEGFAPAGRETLEMQRPIPCCKLPFSHVPVEVKAFAPRDHSAQDFPAVALWREGRRVFELHAQVPDLDALWRLAERAEILSEQQWLVALRPGGGPYLAHIAGGVVRVEKVKVGERPNGEPIYRTRGVLKAASPGEPVEEPDLTEPSPPTIYHEDGRVHVVIAPAPK